MKLNEENYYSKEADKEFMSYSQFKKWLECEHQAYAQYVSGQYKQEQTKAMLVGSVLV